MKKLIPLFVMIILVSMLNVQCTKMPEQPLRNNPFEQGLDNVFSASLTLAQGGAMISWTRPLVAFDHILIYRGISPDPDSMRLIAWEPGDSTRYIDRTIREGNIYYYSLIGENANGRTQSTPQMSLSLLLPTIAIDGDSAFTSEREIGLTAVASRAISIWLGSAPTDSSRGWRTMQDSFRFRLSDGRGMKYVYARFAFLAGDTSALRVDSIATLPVSGHLTYNGTRTVINFRTVALTVTFSGANKMRLSEDSTFTGVPFVPVSAIDTFQLSDSDGTKNIFAQFDNNFGEPVSADRNLQLVLDRVAQISSVEENSGGQMLGFHQFVELTLRTPETGGAAWIRIVDSLGNHRDSAALSDPNNTGTFSSLYNVSIGNNITRGWVIGYYRDVAGNLGIDTATTRLTINLAYNEMVPIPGGSFPMGTNNGGSDEQPVHTVIVSSFVMDRYEVTNQSFAQFLSANVSNAQYWNSGMKISQTGNTFTAIPEFANHPVKYVTYNAAQVYALWAGKRIPTEAEWEYAARGTAARMFPWGNTSNIGPQVNAVPSIRTFVRPGIAIRPDTTTTPVGFYDGHVNMGYQTDNGATPEGIFDLAGNVAEWVNDWYDENYYDNSPLINPQGPATGTYHMLKGGNFGSNTFDLRSGRRYPVDPQYVYNFAGFRCVSSMVVH